MRLIVVAGQTALTALGNGDKVGTWSHCHLLMLRNTTD